MTNSAAAEAMTAARSNLVLCQPFFGALALRLRLIEDPTHPTAWCDGQYLGYNPDWVLTLSREQRLGLLAHEVMHPALLHHTRMGEREPGRWNVACDHAINLILTEANFALPDKGMCDPQYAGLSAEAIYDRLPPGTGAGHPDPGGCGAVRRPQSGGGQGSLEAQEGEWKVAIAQAATAARQMGKLPAALDRLIHEALQPKIPWRSLLQQFFLDRRPADVSWKRPNRRFVYQHLYLPSRETVPCGTLAVVIDTSGSVSGPELDAFATEIRSIHDQLRPDRLLVLYCDAKVHRVDEFGPHDTLTFRAIGGGGTDFRPPFDYLQAHHLTPDALVYLTDGYGTFPTEASYPVLWLINNHTQTPPFGQHVILDL